MEPRVTYPDLQIYSGVRNSVLVDRALRINFANIGKKKYPDGAILHWDADIDAFSEQTGGPHTFNHAVLSPQYQRNADGSYRNVGAKPAVDVFDGEKFLRSCGAVTNLLPSGSEDFLASVGWTITSNITNNPTTIGSVPSRRLTIIQTGATAYIGRAQTSVHSAPFFSVLVKKGNCDWVYFGFNASGDHGLFFNLATGVVGSALGTAIGSIEALGGGVFRLHIWSSTAYTELVAAAPRPCNGDGVSTVTAGQYVDVAQFQLTATAYPVPYVPPGVTQPASNATTTNGVWFSLPNGSPLWQALDGQADGVELVANGVYKLINAEVVRDTITLTGASNEVSFSGDSYNIGTIVGQCYVAHISGVASVLTANERVDIRGVTNIGVIKSNEAFNFQHQFKATANYNTINIYGNGVGNIVITNVSIQRIQPQPLTLATRVRMGVGSGDLVGPTTSRHVITCGSSVVSAYRGDALESRSIIIQSKDGTAWSELKQTWPRNSIINRVTQVSADGTQFRVGYMIEGTHTAIQWSAWANHDGSFDPSTLYRLMLGYNNRYPMWFNKITAWKKQVTDAEILEALS